MPVVITDPTVRNAVRTLSDIYWSSSGWRVPRGRADDREFEAAVRAGVMFRERRSLDHDGWVAAARAAVARIGPADVEAAFIASLATRRLDLRSALGSFAIARRLPAHVFREVESSGLCAVCKLDRQPLTQDPNMLNFERFKWGGVRRDDLTYVSFDLEQFEYHRPASGFAEEELAAGEVIGRRLLNTLRHADVAATVSRLAETQLIGGNAYERRVLMEILGACSILASAAHPGYLDRFVDYEERALPPRHFTDTAYPAVWWTGADGVNEEAVSAFLPRLAA